MPPKTAPTEASPFSATDAVFIVSVLKHAKDMTVDWKGVAAEVGINRADNAGTKFNNILKRVNYKLIGGKMVCLDDAPPITPKKPKAQNGVVGSGKKEKTPGTNKKEQSPTAGKKRTASPGEDEAEADAKKPKVEDAA